MAWPAIIAAGASLASGVMGANAMNKASQAQTDAAYANLDFQREQSNYDRALQQYLMQLQQADRTDAYGNRTHYDPVTGYSVDLAPDVQQAQDAALKEQILRNTTDANQSRQERGTNFDRRQDESATASSLLQEFQRAQQIDPRALYELLVSRGEGARQDETDRNLQGLMRQHLRSGGSQSAGAQIVGQSNAQNAAGRADTAVEAQLAALTQPAAILNQERTGIGNLYNMMASRAANIHDAPFMPDSVSGNIQAGTGGNAANAAIGMRQQAPQIGQLPGPNFGNALAVGSGGNTLKNFFQNQAVQDMFKSDTMTPNVTPPANSTEFGTYFSRPDVRGVGGTWQ